MASITLAPVPIVQSGQTLAQACQQWLSAGGSTQDPAYPNGCPPGYSLKQVNAPNNNQPCGLSYCTNSQGQYASTAGVGVTCPWFSLTNPSDMLLAGGVLSVFVLDGWWKLLGVAAAGLGFLSGIFSQQIAQVNPQTGALECVTAPVSF